MDTRRPTYPPPPPPPSAPVATAHPPLHSLPPQSSHAPNDQRPPPPPFSQTHQPPNTALAQSHHPYAGGPPPPPQSAPNLSLPPLQQAYAPSGPPHEQHLPPFRHPGPPPHDQRDVSEYGVYNQHNRSGHATPAPVNRSYSHDSGSHPQQRTPTTPAHPGPYVSAPPPPDGQQPPPMHHMDHGVHHGYPPANGVPHHGLPVPQHAHHPPPPPPQQHAPQHEVPPPQHYMTPVMENHQGYPPPPGGPPQPIYAQSGYGPPGAAYAQQQQRKKQMRATQACEQCRQRKQKCDEGNPCSFCKENSLHCQYRDTPPANSRTDKNVERILNYLEGHTSALGSIATRLENFDQRLRRVEHAGGFQAAPGADGDDAPAHDERPKPKPELEDHRTAPHKLILLWPSVGPLLRDAGVNLSDSYVMEAEDRGVLRIYTRGEGIDEHDGTQPGGPASPTQSEDSGDGTSASSPPEGLWGTGFPHTPSSDIRRSEPFGAGGLKPDGSLDLDVGTINMLYESYMKHLHIMHPFLDKQRIRKLFDNFIKRYSTGNPNLRYKFGENKFAVGNSTDSERPLKRQRSNGTTGGVQDGMSIRREATERSPGNAIVWLVLALGKICQFKDPLPATVPDGRSHTNQVISHQLTGNPGLTSSSPLSMSIKPSPISPKSTPTTQPTPPNMDGMGRDGGRSRRSSWDGVPVSSARNLDVIPGLAYYAKAAEILGDQGDGNDLVHAQMFLLAGLYKGQLARVKESMSWIVMAGRAIMNLLDRYKLYNDNYWTAYGDIRKQHEKGQARIKDKRHNLIVLASWTCLQLESDILAELRLPSSGIQSIENMLLMPHNMPDDEKENYDGLDTKATRESYDNILLYYTAQMFLRKRLNQVHKEMYLDQCLSQTLNQVREMLDGHERILGFWRETLPGALRWQDDDPPSADILEARLRAKYWGARYVINRPFLDYALHIMPHAKDGRSIQSVATDVHGNPREKAEMHLFSAIELMGTQEVWTASKRCIEAAMQSTVALDGVPDRLIMTNIHGTAHAQFGNMLVLSAAYYNNWLRTLVPEQRFQGLLERTIRFLRRLAPISPTCFHDCYILEKINKLLFSKTSAVAGQDLKQVYRNEGVEVPISSASTSFGATPA